MNSTTQDHDIIYLSKPEPVSMGDEWFEIATSDHFWMKRRFEVLHELSATLISKAENIAEVGCGNGVLQSQIVASYSKPIDGFDLNEKALKKSLAPKNRAICYNVADRLESYKQKYDLIFLFDVIEHIPEEQSFLEHVLFHLKPGGYLAINVPAMRWLFSSYDTAAGHYRRYTLETLDAVASKCSLTKVRGVYWGLSLIPLLILRKIMLSAKTRSAGDTLDEGFAPKGIFTNNILMLLSLIENPQYNPVGTSVMGVYQLKN